MSARLGGPVRMLEGARATRVIDRGGRPVAEHAHDWPVLSLYVMGACYSRSRLGETDFASPSIVFYAAGEAHASRAGADGFEQIEVEFDPSWLGRDAALAAATSFRCMGGAAGQAAGLLARMWGDPRIGESRLIGATLALLRRGLAQAPVSRPSWVDHVTSRLRENPTTRLASLADEVRLNPSWLSRAYRHSAGETMRQTATRRRIEIAAGLLRETQLSPAEISLEAGFCDQSHMSRAFRRLLGRTPGQVRADSETGGLQA
jgi:AraC family transcriptional regulator